MKKSAVKMPTSLRRRRPARAMPRSISTTPDARTIKSGEKGTQGGTCAWNSRRLVVKCNMPVYISADPKSTCTILRIWLMNLVISYILSSVRKSISFKLFG